MYQYLGNTGIKLYDFLNMIGFFALLVFNLTQINQKKKFLCRASTILINKKAIKRAETLIPILEIICFSMLQYAFTSTFNLRFASLTDTGSNYFGLLFFTPIVLSVACIILKVNIFLQIDLLTPAFPLALIFAKLGCFFHGCCRGIECDSGLYNHRSELTEFPIQLVEASLALIIFIFLLCYRKRAKEGTVFPIYLIIYSSTRFFCEFFKADIEDAKTYQYLCIAGIIIGIIELIAAKKFKDRILCFADKVFDFLSQKLHQHAVKNGLIRERPIVHHKKKKK